MYVLKVINAYVILPSSPQKNPNTPLPPKKTLKWIHAANSQSTKMNFLYGVFLTNLGGTLLI